MADAPSSPPQRPMTARELMSKLAASRQGAQTSSPPAGSTAPSAVANPTHNPAAAAAGTGRRMERKRSIVLEFGFNAFSGGIRAGWQTELLSRKFRAAVLAELLGMFLFVTFGSAIVINTNLQGLPSTRFVLIPFGFGLMITVLVFAIGDISGANLNPAVTIALAISRKMSPMRAAFYIAAQCAGAIAGSAYSLGLVGQTNFTDAGGAANAADFRPMNYWTPLGGEFIGTFLLVFVVCAAADVGRDGHTKYVGAMTPLAIGFAVLLAHIALVPIDGCSINPARSLGSAVVAGKWENHWVFWAGPIAGAAAASLIYEYVFKSPAPPPSASSTGGTGYTGAGHGTSFSEVLADIPDIQRTTSGGSDGPGGMGTTGLPPPALEPTTTMRAGGSLADAQVPNYFGGGATGAPSTRSQVVAAMTASSRGMVTGARGGPSSPGTHAITMPGSVELAPVSAAASSDATGRHGSGSLGPVSPTAGGGGTGGFRAPPMGVGGVALGSARNGAADSNPLLAAATPAAGGPGSGDWR